jgi:conjugative transfer signal peptidase TraF
MSTPSLLLLGLGVGLVVMLIVMHGAWYWTVTLTLLVCVHAAHVAAEAGLLVVYTPSVPVGVYWRYELGRVGPYPGEYVCLESRSRAAPPLLREGLSAGWLPKAWLNEPLVKRVAGVAGDRVSYERERGVLINGKALPSSVARESEGAKHALPYPLLPRELEADELWVASEHEAGFDSRYFGPVARSALSCVAEPVWTW